MNCTVHIPISTGRKNSKICLRNTSVIVENKVSRFLRLTVYTLSKKTNAVDCIWCWTWVVVDNTYRADGVGDELTLLVWNKGNKWHFWVDVAAFDQWGTSAKQLAVLRFPVSVKTPRTTGNLRSTRVWDYYLSFYGDNTRFDRKGNPVSVDYHHRQQYENNSSKHMILEHGDKTGSWHHQAVSSAATIIANNFSFNRSSPVVSWHSTISSYFGSYCQHRNVTLLLIYR